jgi:hypothetical protein
MPHRGSLAGEIINATSAELLTDWHGVYVIKKLYAQPQSGARMQLKA